MTPQLSRTIRTAGAGIAAVALVTTVSVSPASATVSTVSTASSKPSLTTTNRAQAAAGWLTTQFVSLSHSPVPSGTHFESAFQGAFYPNYGENDDVLFALAAAKAGAGKAATAAAYLKKHVEDYTDIKGTTTYGPSDGGIGKLAVGALVEGGNGTDFGGYNLMAALKKDECAADATTCTPGSAANIFSSVSESLVLIAEARAGGTYAPSAAAKAYFASLQCASGGFTVGTTACGTGDADLDATSYAIMAMQAMGTSGATLTAAESWLHGQQNKAGYWASQGIANVNSTGLATSALQGVGAKYYQARAWLRTQQIGPGAAAGALRYAGKFQATGASGTSPSVLATAQGLSGLIDGSTLATVTAARSASGVTFFAPVVHARRTEKLGQKYPVFGGGFAAGEKVRITRGGQNIATTKVSAAGKFDITAAVAKSAKPGTTAYKVVGLSSGLSVTHSVRLVT